MQRDNLAAISEIRGAPGSAVLGNETGLIRTLQVARGGEPCFMSEKRLTCKYIGCEWRRECRRLLAVWKR